MVVAKVVDEPVQKPASLPAPSPTPLGMLADDALQLKAAATCLFCFSLAQLFTLHGFLGCIASSIVVFYAETCTRFRPLSLGPSSFALPLPAPAPSSPSLRSTLPPLCGPYAQCFPPHLVALWISARRSVRPMALASRTPWLLLPPSSPLAHSRRRSLCPSLFSLLCQWRR